MRETASGTFSFLSRQVAYRTALALLVLAACLLWLSSRATLSANFLPHWYCLAGDTRLLWTTVIADLLIGISYVAISAALVRIIHRAGRDLPYQGFFWAFGVFIISFGMKHFLEVVTVWKPVYWLSAVAKAITAVASIGTALVLILAAEDIAQFVRSARQLAARRGDAKFRALIIEDISERKHLELDLTEKTGMRGWNQASRELLAFAVRRTGSELGFLGVVLDDGALRVLAQDGTS